MVTAEAVTKKTAKPVMYDSTEQDITIERILTDEVKTREIDEDHVQELMRSFLKKGQQEAIKIRPINDYYYKVTFGEHRTEAARRLAAGKWPSGEPPPANPEAVKAKWRTIRAIVEKSTELDSIELKITENGTRNEFNHPYLVGKLLDQLLRERYDGSVDALADSLGKKTQWVTDRTSVFHKLDPSLIPFVGNKLTVANTISLCGPRIRDRREQLEVANAIIRSRSGNQSSYRGGSAGLGEGGYLAPRTNVKVKCECQCGNIHDKPDISIAVDD